MKYILNVINWIKNNKFKFVLFDIIILIVNLIIFNIINYKIIVNFDIILNFIVINIIFCFVYFIFKLWLIFANKYDFIFLKIGNIGNIISLCFIKLFLILNILLILLIWINKTIINGGGIHFYFAIPWLILMSINVYKNDKK